METCDEEFRDAAVEAIRRQHEADTPFFVWFNSTHMHFRTHPKPESVGRAVGGSPSTTTRWVTASVARDWATVFPSVG